VNTEGILRGKATWKNVRVGKTASLFDFSAIGSARMQTAWVKANWFLGPGGSRLSVAPLIQLTHENLEQKETLSAREQFGLSTTLDQEGVGNLFFSGPTLDQFRTFRGVGIPYFNYLSLESRWAMKSHEFEYYASNPKTGFNLGLTTNLSNIQKLNLRGELLWNFKNYDPALWIFAVRGGFASLIADGGENPETRFPGDFFQYLGGSTDLRGFGLQELPREGTPRALTAGFLGFEARLSNTLPAGVDPFVFVDLGMLGTQSMGFNSTLYWSPGAGIRWASPIGVIRTTAARGFSHSPQDHWQFYFNYGEEF
jgi:outer membrane translocation and assembly module TamA